MTTFRGSQRRDLLKLLVFGLVTAAITSYLVIIFKGDAGGDRRVYHAVFQDVSGLKVGDQVRAASVVVGRVQQMELEAGRRVVVTVGVDRTVRMDSAVSATVKYKNLVGDRYLALEPGAEPGTPMAPGGTIPATRTASALDLDRLLNGFKPLFVGLAPKEINELSANLVEVLQGQRSNVSALVASIASLTATLGEREELVTGVIDNLSSAVSTVDSRRSAVDQLIVELASLVEGLDREAPEVIAAIDRIDGFAADASDLVREIRADTTPSLRSLERAASDLDERSGTLEDVLQELPGHYDRILAAGSYGNFFNFFLCGVRLQIDGQGAAPLPWTISEAPRCQR